MKRLVHLRIAAVRSQALDPPSIPTASPTADQTPAWAAALLQEASVVLRRYAGGVVAALESSHEADGSAYIAHPATADGCLQAGAVFMAAPAETEEAAKTPALVPSAVGAYMAERQSWSESQNPRGEGFGPAKWGRHGRCCPAA